MLLILGVDIKTSSPLLSVFQVVFKETHQEPQQLWGGPIPEKKAEAPYFNRGFLAAPEKRPKKDAGHAPWSVGSPPQHPQPGIEDRSWMGRYPFQLETKWKAKGTNTNLRGSPNSKHPSKLRAVFGSSSGAGDSNEAGMMRRH